MNLGDLNETAIREIRAEMARQALNQTGLALRIGWTQRSVSRRLSGTARLSLDDIETIAEALDISVLRLLWPGQAAQLLDRKGKR